jgi:hypothetical protein
LSELFLRTFKKKADAKFSKNKIESHQLSAKEECKKGRKKCNSDPIFSSEHHSKHFLSSCLMRLMCEIIQPSFQSMLQNRIIFYELIPFYDRQHHTAQHQAIVT